MSSEDTRSLLLEKFPALAGLAPSHLERLLSASQLRRAPAGASLFAPNQPCSGFPLLLRESVRVTKTSASGREILLY
ncbi:MAG: Crp/Fnr family transcriptional regulator, partial [Betaproteobacteria bacterium]